MKTKGLIVLVTVFLLSGIFANSNAQSINLGGGLVIGTDRPNVGLKLQGTYGMDFLLENLSTSAAFTFFIPASPTNTTYSRWSIDLDGHYKFYTVSDFEFYAIGGLNIAHYKTEVKAFGITASSSGTKPGLNVGAGAIYNFKPNMKAFSEFKYILSNYDQAEITFGVLFEL